MANEDAFLEVLAGCTEVCADMDLSDDGWKPPNGEFNVMVEGVTSDTSEKDGVTKVWIKPMFTILDGEFKGRSFTDYYWIEPGLKEPSIAIKNLCRFATCLQGAETRNPIEAFEIVKASVGEFLNIEVWRGKPSQKTGKIYANIRFCQTLPATDASPAIETADATEG